MDKNITKRQEDVLNYIKKYVVEHTIKFPYMKT